MGKKCRYCRRLNQPFSPMGITLKWILRWCVPAPQQDVRNCPTRSLQTASSPHELPVYCDSVHGLLGGTSFHFPLSCPWLTQVLLLNTHSAFCLCVSSTTSVTSKWPSLSSIGPPVCHCPWVPVSTANPCRSPPPPFCCCFDLSHLTLTHIYCI